MKRKPKILVKKEEGICYKPSIQSYSAVFIITTLVYVRSIDAEFVYDDRQAILSNQDVVGDDPWLLDVFSHDFWGNPMSNRGSHKSFRPLTTLTFRAGRLLHGLQPQLFHAVNVFLHAATSCLVLMMMSKFLGKVGSLSSATIFAVHAANTEAVCSIVGRADILATATVILGFLDFQRNEGTRLTPVFAIVALFFKETGIVLLPLIGLHIVLMTLAPCFHMNDSGSAASDIFLTIILAQVQLTTAGNAGVVEDDVEIKETRRRRRGGTSFTVDLAAHLLPTNCRRFFSRREERVAINGADV
ncbi:unnamed protein product [Caenorhabditis auriculariae]|uniref:Transmembrane and TPR repeat-containing protein 3 n=1 Tax=Caenorhabditis auriculariae TaxID=2777116 RepID=A0A8S1GRF7_9PELO|nr:unnamed protein product [Caenorhabditis auriculariae]